MVSRKWLSFLVVILMVTGCGDHDDNTTEDTVPDTEVQEETPTEKEEPSEEEAIKSDEDLTEQIKADEGIADVMVQVVEGERQAVNVDINMTDDQALSPDEIVEKYGELIKEHYPDYVVDIIVAKNGTLLKQETLE